MDWGNTFAWAVTELPGFYLAVLTGALPTGLGPWIGIVFAAALLALAAGLVWAAVRREPNILRFALPVIASHLFVYLLSLLAAVPIAMFGASLVLVVVEIVLVRLAWKRSIRARAAAGLVGAFCLVYAGAALLMFIRTLGSI